MSVGFDSGFAVQSVAFPPRNEPFAFRQQLETVYQVQLRRNPISTFVDIEGTIVWTTEYLRYRVSGCDHATAAQLVIAQIGGAAPTAGCQTFTLVGVVSDGTLGGPAPGTAVTATDSKGTSRSTTTDGGGFSLSVRSCLERSPCASSPQDSTRRFEP